jgi:SAM domain (Sterile alpha motif)
LYVSLVCDASGLDDGISQYSNNFITNDVTGSQLFALTNDELLEMGITKIGHQEMLLDSISLLEAIVSIERYLLCGRVAALTGAIMEWKTGADDNAKRFI